MENDVWTWSYFWFGILINISSAILIAAFWYFWRCYIRFAIKIKKQQKGEKKDLEFFTANPLLNGIQTSIGNAYQLSYFLELLGCAKLTYFFKRKYKNVNICYHPAPISFEPSFTTMDKLKKDTILIGGPNHNSISDFLLNKCTIFQPNKAELRFEKIDDRSHLIIAGPRSMKKTYFQELWKKKKKKRSTESKWSKDFKRGIEKKDHSYDDYALIINIKNPFNSNKRLIATMGCGSAGCFGGASYIAEQLARFWNPKAWMKAWIKKEYIMVISCNGDQEQLHGDPTPELFIEVESEYTQTENGPRGTITFKKGWEIKKKRFLFGNISIWSLIT